MKMIIDIPEDMFEWFKNGEIIDEYDKSALKQVFQNGILLDDVKAEFINSYPTNYMGEPELNGASCHFSLNKVLEILDNIGNAESEKLADVGLLTQSLEDAIDCS